MAGLSGESMSDSLFAFLKVTGGSLAGQRFEIKAGTIALIGRQAQCDLAFPDDQTISHRQCQIQFDPPNCKLIDLSLNGTHVNGDRVYECKLSDGDKIQFGTDAVIELSIVSPEDTINQPPETGESQKRRRAPAPKSPAVRSRVTHIFEVEMPEPEPFSTVEIPFVPCCLSVTSGPLAGTVMEVKEGQPLVVGRLSDCDLIIDSDPTISRKQCQIEFNPPTCRVTDFSRHGTFVNGHMEQSAPLEHEDEIQIGSNTVLQIHIQKQT